MALDKDVSDPTGIDTVTADLAVIELHCNFATGVLALVIGCYRPDALQAGKAPFKTVPVVVNPEKHGTQIIEACSADAFLKPEAIAELLATKFPAVWNEADW